MKTTFKKLAIAIPTYNEAENLEELLNKLRKTVTTLKKWQIDIVIIDDNSPDGTAKKVQKYQADFPGLHLMEGRKEGLGAAYTRAFQYILKNLKPDYIMQMDADLQHNPSDIPRFLIKAEQGYDFIIGSRYITGGDYPNWSFKRKILSWGANFIARNIAGIYHVKDCTSGFRCISANFLKSFALQGLKTNSYAFQMSLLHAASKKTLRIVEIPILFPNRKKGNSKLGHRDIREFFINAFQLRFKKY